MTPFQIIVLLHYHTTPGDFEWDGSPAMLRDAQDCLYADQLLSWNTKDGQRFAITDRGRALVEAMCRLPLPVMKWVMPEE